MANQVALRKDAHLTLCLDKTSVEFQHAATGLGGYTLEYDALPELNFEEVDLSITMLGKRLRAPILIGSMTGGTEHAKTINHRLAKAAAATGLGMSLGSQRAMIENPQLTSTFAVRHIAPELPLLFGNIGAIQLNYGMTTREIRAALEAVSADAVNFHLNPLQESIQPEGDTRFSGLALRLAETISELAVPAMIKEVGAGISAKTARKLAALPIAGVEASGVGGTSWARVESHRASPNSVQAHAGHQLGGFGIPTSLSIQHCRTAMGKRLVIASGGIRTGMDIAVALALGADAVALARPLLEAASESEQSVIQQLEKLMYELRVICFCTGSHTIEALRNVQIVRPESSWMVAPR